MVGLLALRARRPSAIAREIGRSRPATSRQLRLLREAGLIRVLSAPFDGRATLYAIDLRAHGRITPGSRAPRLGSRIESEVGERTPRSLGPMLDIRHHVPSHADVRRHVPGSFRMRGTIAPGEHWAMLPSGHPGSG